jgi:hypothetical protein
MIIPVVRDYDPDLKIIALTDDLHHIRMKLTDKKCDFSCVDKLKQRETRIYEDSDLVLAITRQDKNVIKKLLPKDADTILDVVPYTIDFQSHESDIPSFSNRTNSIIYVGSKHEANVLAVKFILTKIFPRVRDQIPDARLVLVGAKQWQSMARGIAGVEAYAKV